VIAEKRDRGSGAKLTEVMERAQRLNALVYWLTYSPFLQPFTVKPKTAEDLKPEAERIKIKQCDLCAKPDDTPVPPDLGPGGLMYGLGELFRLSQPDLSSLFTRTTGGRTLGFPTLNLELENEVVPATGVYATRATLLDAGEPGRGASFGSVTNVGRRPTFGSAAPLRVEAHLFGFGAEAYGRRVELAFLARLREERRFPDVEALRAQIARDAEAARRHLEKR
jgi:hypothetical protein